MEKIKLGVSSCLLGDLVRYDGGHKKNDYIVEELTHYFEFQSFCPEMAIGLGVPREPIRIVNVQGQEEVINPKKPEQSYTKSLKDYALSLYTQLEGLSGYIFKNKSPSCGVKSVKIYDEEGQCLFQKKTSGAFAQQVQESFPYLPIEEEGRLTQPRLKENFITRVYAYWRWQSMVQNNELPKNLVNFHTQYKFVLLSHNEVLFRDLGRLVSQCGEGSYEKIKQDYLHTFTEALKTLATPKTHVNTLMHLMGYLKDKLDTHDKKELLNQIERYRLGKLPLIVPITLIKYFFSKHPHPYIEGQYYLEPHPDELMLRNSL